MPLDQAEATRLMNASWNKNGAYVAPSGVIRARLMSANGSASANGTEVANGGGSAYASQDASAATPSTATNGVMTSNAAMTYTNMPAVTVVGLELWDSAGSPRRIRFGPLTTAKTTALGDSLTIASGSLVNTLA